MNQRKTGETSGKLNTTIIVAAIFVVLMTTLAAACGFQTMGIGPTGEICTLANGQGQTTLEIGQLLSPGSCSKCEYQTEDGSTEPADLNACQQQVPDSGTCPDPQGGIVFQPQGCITVVTIINDQLVQNDSSDNGCVESECGVGSDAANQKGKVIAWVQEGVTQIQFNNYSMNMPTGYIANCSDYTSEYPPTPKQLVSTAQNIGGGWFTPQATTNGSLTTLADQGKVCTGKSIVFDISFK